MAEHPDAAGDEIARRLGVACAAGSPNRISSEQLRKWAIEYLGEFDKEVAQYPELADRPHQNLWMRDARFADALFAVLVFRPDSLEFFCGTGDAFEIRTFAETESPRDAEDMFREMETRFPIPQGSIRLDRRSAESWLGRTW